MVASPAVTERGLMPSPLLAVVVPAHDGPPSVMLNRCHVGTKEAYARLVLEGSDEDILLLLE